MIVNLTPHAITVVRPGAELGEIFKPDGSVARVTATRELSRTVDGIPVFRSTYGKVEGLPGEVPGTYWLVSAMVRQAVPHRRDVLSPGELIRDDKGQPTGCRGLEGNQ